MTGNTQIMTPNASKAERVPVINNATALKATKKTCNAMFIEPRALAASHSDSGSVQIKNSAKKLRFTNVEAGFGPCAKNPKSNQNCSAVHNEATMAPA